MGQKEATCTLDTWEGNWTLVAKNLLGQYSLTDTAELSHRGRWLNLSFSPSLHILFW